MWTTIYSIIDQFGTIIGIAGAIISFLIWLKVRKQTKELAKIAASIMKMDNYKDQKKYLEGITTENPKAFCLSLTTNTLTIKDSVRRFLIQSKIDMPIIELNFEGLDPIKFEDFVIQVKLKRRLELSDATEIHLFIQGPIIAGTIIGAVFDNWIPIKLYHFTGPSTATYEYWGPLVKQH